MTDYTHCPCCNNQLGQTEISYKMSDIFHNWEICGVQISQQTRAEYPQDLCVGLSMCSQCGFGVYLPMTTGTDSFYSDVTAGDYYLHDRWDFHEALKEIGKTGATSILDIGCGKGAFLSLAANKLPHLVLYGNDENPTVCSVMGEQVKFSRSLDNIPSGIDCITLFQVLEHVSDPVGLIQKASEKLSPRGMLIVSVPDYDGPVRFFPESHTAVPPHHVTLWTMRSLESLLLRMGMEIRIRKVEPLPDYLFSSYLPAILRNAIGIRSPLGRKAGACLKMSKLIIKFCKLMNIHSLPIHGHTCMAIAQKSS